MIRDPPCTIPAPNLKTYDLAPLPDHFSFSSMQQFQMCPRKWFYGYLAKAPRERQPSSLLFGASLHEAVAYLHLARQKGKKVRLATLESAFETCWNKGAAGAEICFGKTETKESLFRISRELLKLLTAHGSGEGRVLAVERSVRLKLPELSVPIVGRVDLLSETDGIVLLDDFKTSRNTLSADQLAQGSAQLALYTSALRDTGRRCEVPSRARLVLLRKLKTPKIEHVAVDIGASSLQRARRMLSETWRLIEAAASSEAFPAKPSWACGTCPFRDRCMRETSESIEVTRRPACDPKGMERTANAKSESLVVELATTIARWLSR